MVAIAGHRDERRLGFWVYVAVLQGGVLTLLRPSPKKDRAAVGVYAYRV